MLNARLLLAVWAIASVLIAATVALVWALWSVASAIIGG